LIRRKTLTSEEEFEFWYTHLQVGFNIKPRPPF
jgi:hypothetical protein